MNNCIICKSSHIVSYGKAGKDYPLSKCLGCGLIFDQDKKNGENIYNKDYYQSQELKGGYFNYFEESIVNKLTFRHRLIQISKKINNKKAKLLDIGCALGDFLEVAKSLLWKNISGVDLSSFAVSECRKKGLNTQITNSIHPLEKIFAKNSFDVITLQDVIEHYENPLSQIEKIYQILKPGGSLFITTPNSASLTIKIMGKYWYHYKKNEHLFYFNSGNIRKLLKQLGFKTIVVKRTPSWVTIKYLTNRLSYYLPKRYHSLLNNLTKHSFAYIVFPIYTGEMEVWGTKPENSLK